MRNFFYVLTVSVALSSSLARSEESEKIAPFQASIIASGLSYEGRETRINGVVMGIWSENPQTALSISLFNGATGNSKGLQLGLLNYAENYSGVQWGIINHVSGNFSGWQDGAFNYVGGMFTGFQSGCINIVKDGKGFQLGLLNVATNFHGLQVGAVNLNISNNFFSRFPSEVSPGMVLVNWSF
jgi:hypothetical protein